MAGIDNGTFQSGVVALAKQFGAILRGSGPPVPQAGAVGDLYIDVQTWFLYEKRQAEATDPWGHYLFPVVLAYRSGLKWFGASLPTNDIGVDGDYYLLWGAYNNYGLQPSICGPKANGCWPESGDGPALLLDPAYAGFTLPVGASDEGTARVLGPSWQLLVAGVADEYVLSLPLSQLPNTPLYGLGVASPPAVAVVNINPLYDAADNHAV